jgi:hypothetical protein
MRLRLQGGKLIKARRGELFMSLDADRQRAHSGAPPPSPPSPT